MYGLTIERGAKLSITQQLTGQLRDSILQNRLRGGERLPSTRMLAQELQVARNVIIQVYEQLLAEGYLETRMGAGTYVAELPYTYQRGNAFEPSSTNQGRTILKESNSHTTPSIAFRVGQPDQSSFPRKIWAKLAREVCLEVSDEVFAYGLVQGEYRLRQAICEYLFRSKSMICVPEQLVILSGTAQGVDLIATWLREQGRDVGVEDPGDGFTPAIFSRHGLTTTPVPVDALGVRVDALNGVNGLGALYIVPSHQFPLGGVLPIQRRLSLIRFAEENDLYLIEDDYDGEYRYNGEPIQSLRSLSTNRVIYLGTFSKTLSPALRLSFALFPEHLLDKILELKEELNMRTTVLEQHVLARFLESKAMDRHVFRMKRIYAERRRILIKALQDKFGEKIKITGENAGIHLVVEFEDGILNRRALERLAKEGVQVEGVEDYAIRKGFHGNKLVLGYGALDERQIVEGVHRMQCALR